MAFEVWWVPFAFLDRPDHVKNRPAIILDWQEELRLALVTKVTSNVERVESGYVLLRDWQEAGLEKPSAARCSQVLAIPQSVFLDDDPVGRLSHFDAFRIAEAIAWLHPGLL
ncbi:type II toxin-antitoxin system PemK/MazF family toxin [Raoultibacter phocaeensis]|uniref:type II toxin-antitoxin system PemK/MazF family toxin n=1 Tax=Raoultibacter phocaeensis TaxID=2479841 RepID=UPI001C578F1D|nr:type II toxin-antitoxin system PemK/MazF family toxin [Raoultibacter phocaeensis]